MSGDDDDFISRGVKAIRHGLFTDRVLDERVNKKAIEALDPADKILGWAEREMLKTEHARITKNLRIDGGATSSHTER